MEKRLDELPIQLPSSPRSDSGFVSSLTIHVAFFLPDAVPDALSLFLSLILTAVIGGGNSSSSLHLWNVRLVVCKWWSHCSEAVRVALVLPPLLNPPHPFSPPNSMKQALTEDSAKQGLAHREVMVRGALVLMGFTSRGK